MTSTNQVTVKELAEEINLPLDALIPQLVKMGMSKEIDGEKRVPGAIAKNIRLVVNSRNSVALPSSPPPSEKPGELKTTVGKQLAPKEVKAIASSLDLPITVVRGLSKALHDQELQIAFLEGYKEIERQERLETALETGKVAAQLKGLERKEARLKEREEQLIQEGLEDASPQAIASKFGIDLNSLFAALHEQSEEKAKTQLDQESAISTFSALSEEELANANPFLQLAYRRSKKG